MFVFLSFVSGSALFKKKLAEDWFKVLNFNSYRGGGFKISWGTSYWPFMLLWNHKGYAYKL